MKYFKHQSNMRHDTKIRLLVNRFGLEGYGLYNLILESITESLEDSSPVPELTETCSQIAELYNGNTEHINEMASWMINAGLFSISEISERIICPKIFNYLDSFMTRSDKVKGMINRYKKAEKIGEFAAPVLDRLGQNQPETETETETETESKNTAPAKPAARPSGEPKAKHGEFKHVLLTTSEEHKLCGDFGFEETRSAITYLDEYIEMKGYKAKSHYLALRKWVFDAVKESTRRKAGVDGRAVDAGTVASIFGGAS